MSFTSSCPRMADSRSDRISTGATPELRLLGDYSKKVDGLLEDGFLGVGAHAAQFFFAGKPLTYSSTM